MIDLFSAVPCWGVIDSLGACIPFLTYWVWVMDFWQDWFWPEYCWAKWINIVNFSAWSWRIVTWMRTFFFQLKYVSYPGCPEEASPCQLLPATPQHLFLEMQRIRLLFPLCSAGSQHWPTICAYWAPLLSPLLGPQPEMCTIPGLVSVTRRERCLSHLFLLELWFLTQYITYFPQT